MSDLIERQAAIDALEKWESESTWDEWCYDHKDEAEKYNIISPSSVVFGLPSALQERKTGTWKRHYSRPNVYADLYWHCSECGYKNDDQYANKYHKFCPNCGAEMDGSE